MAGLDLSQETPFASLQGCVDDLKKTFDETAPELIQIFSESDPTQQKKRVEAIVLEFSRHTEYVIGISDDISEEDGETGNIRKMVLHVCRALTERFSNAFFINPPGAARITSEVEKLQQEIKSIQNGVSVLVSNALS